MYRRRARRRGYAAGFSEFWGECWIHNVCEWMMVVRKKDGSSSYIAEAQSQKPRDADKRTKAENNVIWIPVIFLKAISYNKPIRILRTGILISMAGNYACITTNKTRYIRFICIHSELHSIEAAIGPKTIKIAHFGVLAVCYRTVWPLLVQRYLSYRYLIRANNPM